MLAIVIHIGLLDGKLQQLKGNVILLDIHERITLRKLTYH